MKRIVAWAAVAVLAMALESLFPGTDVGDLQPVRVVWIGQGGSRYVVCTDTGQTGTGQDLQSAIDNLNRTASGKVFLDTADYLLLDRDCKSLLPELTCVLRPGTEVCLTDGTADLEETGQFLTVHPPNIRLIQCAAGQEQIPILKIREGRMELIESSR